MAAPTITIEPEELLGLSALTELERAGPAAAPGPEPGLIGACRQAPPLALPPAAAVSRREPSRTSAGRRARR